jgi:hypothetical protein
MDQYGKKAADMTMGNRRAAAGAMATGTGTAAVSEWAAP